MKSEFAEAKIFLQQTSVTRRGNKKLPKYCKKCPKSSHTFYLKIMFFQHCPKRDQIFGLLLNLNCCQELSKMGQSGRTERSNEHEQKQKAVRFGIKLCLRVAKSPRRLQLASQRASKQCDQIWRYIGLWATFQSLWQQ